MTQNSQFDGRQSEEEISYLMRSRNVPGRRGTLREEQEDELISAGYRRGGQQIRQKDLKGQKR